MRAQVEISRWGDGGEPLGPPLLLPEAVAEFDFINLIEQVVGWVKDFYTGSWAKLGTDVVEALSKLGGDVKDAKKGTVAFGQGGVSDGVDRPVSYAVVLFHAWTGDDIKPSFGRVNAGYPIGDLGERRYTRGDFQYEYLFYVPLSIVPVGRYAFTFGTGDSGTVQDATIGYVVEMEITPPPPQPTIDQRYAQLGGGGGFLGQASSPELATPDGIGRFRHYQGGSLYWTPGRGAHEAHGAIRDRWAALGWERGFLSYPLSDELPTPDGVGRFNHFQGGSVYWTPQTGAHEVHGAIRSRWAELGWERSFLGYPVSDESGSTANRFNNFQGGSIRWTPDGGARESHEQTQ
jgi:hypothetical protein